MAYRDADSLAGDHAGAIFRYSIMTMGTRVAITLVNIPTSVLVARLLGPEGQGTYASAIVFPMLFAFVGLLGIDASHTYLLAKKQYSIAQINGQSVLLTIVLSAIATPAYLVFVRFYGGVAGPELKSVLGLAALLIPVLMAKSLSVAFLLGLQRMRWFNGANLLQASGLLVLMCVNLFVFRGGTRGALIAYLTSEITVILVAFGVARRAVGSGRLLEKPPPGLFRRSVRYGLQGHVGEVLVALMYRFDMFLVLSIVGLGAQGIYSVAVVLAEKLTHIARSVQIVLFPKLSSLDADDVDELTPTVTRSSFLLTVIFAILLYLVGKPILQLFYGSQYLAALRPFRILIPGIAMLSFSTILSGALSARDKRIYLTIASAAGFAVNLLLCWMWIPRIGLEGAAWASTVAYTVRSLAMLAFFKKVSRRSIVETVLVQREDLPLFAAVLKRALRR